MKDTGWVETYKNAKGTIKDFTRDVEFDRPVDLLDVEELKQQKNPGTHGVHAYVKERTVRLTTTYDTSD